MHEDDIGRVLAAAAPEEVPMLTDLHHRARAQGRRHRTYRNVLTAGGTGVAVVAVAGIALAFGGGNGSGAPDGKVAAGAGSAVTTTKMSAPGTTHTPATTDKAKAYDAKTTALMEVVNAKLPNGWSIKEVQASSGEKTYSASFLVTEPNGAVVGLAVKAGPVAGSTASCPGDAKCTSGTAQLFGHPAGWVYATDFSGNAVPGTKPSGSGPTQEVRVGNDAAALAIVDGAKGYRIDLSSSGKAKPNVLSMDELKNIGLSEEFVSAVLAARDK